MSNAGSTSHLHRLRGFSSSFFGRLLLGLLAASVPVMIVLAVVLTRSASSALEDSVGDAFQLTAAETSAQIDNWLDERDGDLRVVATQMEGPQLGSAEISRLKRFAGIYGVYNGIQVLDSEGEVLAASDPNATEILEADGAWFSRALQLTRLTVSLPADGVTRLIVTRRFTGTDGERRLVVADLKQDAVSRFLDDAENDVEFDTLVVDAGRRVIARSGVEKQANKFETDTERREFDTPASRLALAGEADWLRAGGYVSGYAPVKSLGWGVVVREREEIALASIFRERELALLIVIIGIVLTSLFALLFARRATRPISALAQTSRRVAAGDLDARVKPSGPRELRELAESFNAMIHSLDSLVAKVRRASTEISTSATQLAASSEELSATATEQSTAATETSATMEELARTSTSIAEGAAAVARQSAETRAAIAQADEDISASSLRTLALSDQVGQIGGILALINELADQTNLQALNAAIEAARAGEAGAGFAVVADEVRSLAERSKKSAEQIAAIVQGTQSETNATVMAMEKGSTQLRRGVELMDLVTEAIGQVQHTTQQQEAAGAEVVETMESLSDGSRQTSLTIDEVAASVSNLAALAADLALTAAHSDGTEPAPGDSGPAVLPGLLVEPAPVVVTNGHGPVVGVGER